IVEVLEGLDYLHTKCKMIHTDIKPENVLVSMANGKIKVKIADVGNACWADKPFSDKIQTREYRSPEVVIGVGYGTSADIWSTACMAFELATGDYLFKPMEGQVNGDENTLEADLLEKITFYLGPIPPQIFQAGSQWSIFFNRQGKLRHVPKKFHEEAPYTLIEHLMDQDLWTYDDASNFSSFLTSMLELN
ncbi:hypothetical protein PENTCL1PPCAC_25524, partial [Pristionchus entomophagus]